MKNLVLVLAMVIMSSMFTFGQKKTEQILAKGTVVEWKIQKFDGIDVFIYTFRNAKYSSISDYGSILFIDRPSLTLFADNLIGIGNEKPYTKVEYGTYRTNNCMFTIENSPDIYVYNEDNQYFNISHSQAVSLGNEIKKYVNLLPVVAPDID